MGIVIKSEKEIAIMRRACQVVSGVLSLLSQQVKPGMKTRELDIIAEKELKAQGAESSFKGYRGFPATLCVSVNNEIVHGIPGDKVLKEGDIVSLDFGAVCNGFHGDAAITVAVGKTSPEAEQLIKTTRDCLEAGISVARAGVHLGDVSAAIQNYAESKGYSVVRAYTGHGIGRILHEDPQIPNCTEPPFGLKPGTGPVLKKGMTLALEPMLNIGDWHTQEADDHWTVLTVDGSLSAHFEHTIAIDDNEPEVLTRGVYA
jgi:methionyl aminopeptidase